MTTELAAIYREQVPPVYYQKTTENGTYCYVGGTPECEALVAVCEERGIELPMDLYYSSASRSKLGGAEAAQLAGVIASGAAPRLEALSLFHNQIGNTGCMALAAALAKEGAAPRLKQLDLRSNKIGDEGCDALAAALGKEGAAPRLDDLSLGDNEIGDEGCTRRWPPPSARRGQRRGSSISVFARTRSATRAAMRWPPPSRRGPPRA